jgi:hypothetical protein
MIIMRLKLLAALLGAGALMLSGAYAQTSVTATCKDGSSFSGASKSGACRGHGGVGTWGTTSTAGAIGTTAASTDTKAADATPTGRTTDTPAATRTRTTQTPAKPGGGAGQVWVNSSSKVYHCEGDRYYGKTKAGSYMTEAAAKAAGDRPKGGKACS